MARNVLQLIESFRTGGSERQAVDLTCRLHERGRFRVHVACLEATGVLRPRIDELGLDTVPEYPLTSFYDRNALTQVRRFARHLRAAKIDVVHTHDFYTNIFGMAGARLAGVPVRIASRRETTGTRGANQKRAERLAYRLASAVVVNADAVGDQLRSEGTAPRKIVTIHNGVDRATLGAPANDVAFASPWASPRKIVTIVANLRLRVKDHPTFLRAARRVVAEVPEAGFVIAGEGALLEEMRALASQLGIDRDVSFLGRCDSVATLLDASSVCVLSSTAEGFSNAILEYMAAAKPVVATDVGGARESVAEGESGFLVAAGDAESMASRIVDLLRDPERAEAMGRRGRAIVAERFTGDVQVQRVEELYERLLAPTSAKVAQSIDRLAGRVEEPR